MHTNTVHVYIIMSYLRSGVGAQREILVHTVCCTVCIVYHNNIVLLFSLIQLMLSGEDLKEMGVPMGPRKKLTSYITVQKKQKEVHMYSQYAC